MSHEASETEASQGRIKRIRIDRRETPTGSLEICGLSRALHFPRQYGNLGETWDGLKTFTLEENR